MKHTQLTFLYVAIFASILFLGLAISPFITTIVLAAILVTGTYPIYHWILGRVGGRRTVASIIVSLSIGVVFSVIVFVFILLLSQEAVTTYQSFETWIRSGNFNINEWLAHASKYVGIPPVDLVSSITKAAQTLSGNLVEQSTNLIKSIVWLILNFFLLVFTMFFLYKDGQVLVQ